MPKEGASIRETETEAGVDSVVCVPTGGGEIGGFTVGDLLATFEAHGRSMGERWWAAKGPGYDGTTGPQPHLWRIEGVEVDGVSLGRGDSDRALAGVRGDGRGKDDRPGEAVLLSRETVFVTRQEWGDIDWG